MGTYSKRRQVDDAPKYNHSGSGTWPVVNKHDADKQQTCKEEGAEVRKDTPRMEEKWQAPLAVALHLL